MSFGDLVKKIKLEVLEYPFNSLVIAIYDSEIHFRLYDEESVVIVYNREKEDLYLSNCEEEGSVLGNLDYSTLKDIAGVMKVLNENMEILNNLLD